jgi:Toprim domain
VSAGRSIGVGAIAALLADRAEALCAQLLPAGIREGAEWRIGNVAGEPGRSMAVHLRGAKAGVWYDWAAGSGGDALDLAAQVLFRGDKRQAVRWARAWLGIGDADPAPFAPHRHDVMRRVEVADREDASRRRQAMRIFLEAQLSLTGTVAEAYLHGRAIDLARLARQPRALRFHPRLWNEESQRTWPALIAAIVEPDGRMIAVHRTWLAPAGSGKAALRNPKMTLGRYSGACVRLWRGASGKPLKDAVHGETVLIAEGIEDGLSAAVAAPEYRVLAAVSLANLANLMLPPAIGCVVILAQNDPIGSPATHALERAVAAFRRRGRRVKLARPPAPIKDINDLLRGAV